MDEIAAVPPVVSILSGDDRDPAKLLNFTQNRLDCDYTIDDLKRLVQTSLFLNPYVRACIKGESDYPMANARHVPDKGESVVHNELVTIRTLLLQQIIYLFAYALRLNLICEQVNQSCLDGTSMTHCVE